jgi:hypothetical protein
MSMLSYKDIFVSTAEAARHLGLSISTLCKMRCTGTGPEYVKLGRTVWYSLRSLDLWRDQRRTTSTTDSQERLPRRLADPFKPKPGPKRKAEP